jgi:hypothetical protein
MAKIINKMDNKIPKIVTSSQTHTHTRLCVCVCIYTHNLWMAQKEDLLYIKNETPSMDGDNLIKQWR